MEKNKHLTDANRLEIEHGLRHGQSIKKIAAKIGKHHSTVAREIRARSLASDKGAFGRLTNRCASRRSCEKHPLSHVLIAGCGTGSKSSESGKICFRKVQLIALFQFALEFQPFGFPIGGGIADNQENVLGISP